MSQIIKSLKKMCKCNNDKRYEFNQILVENWPKLITNWFKNIFLIINGNTYQFKNNLSFFRFLKFILSNKLFLYYFLH